MNTSLATKGEEGQLKDGTGKNHPQSLPDNCRNSVLDILQRVSNDGKDGNNNNNNHQSLQQFREAVTQWNQSGFDGNKLVIVQNHLNSHDSPFQGNDESVTRFLTLAVQNGIPLEWYRGRIKYRIYGCYRTPDPWRGLFTYEWAGTREAKMTLSLQNFGTTADEEMTMIAHSSDVYVDHLDDDFFHFNYKRQYRYSMKEIESRGFHEDGDHDDGNVVFDGTTELVPRCYYDSMEPYERFLSTFPHGVFPKRMYDTEKTIVLWPKSWNWSVMSQGDLGVRDGTWIMEHAS